MSGRRAAAALAAAGLFVLAPVGGVVALAAVTPPPTPPPAAGSSSCAAAGQGATLIASAAKGTPWPADQLVTAVAISIAESNGVPTATNFNTNGSTDYGLWQINSIHTDVLSAGDWKDPAANAHMAFVIWQQAGGSWQPWSTYNSGAYQSHIAEATSAVAGTPAPTCTAPPPAAGGPTGPTSPAAATIIAAARTMLGVPYTWGGASEATGFDCSGLTMWAYAQAGIALPHNAAAQEAMSRPTSTPRPGDLVFFDQPAGHVAIYLGGGQMLAAPHTGDVVKVEAVYGGARYGAILP